VQEIFASSRRRLAAYTHVADVDIEKVRQATGIDAFQEIEKPTNDADVIAFMSYMFTPQLGRYDPGIGLTIGTGLKNIGERLYFGGSFKFSSRLVFTVGGLTQKVKEGDRVLQADKNLFESLKNVRELGWFFSLSATPF